MNYMPDLAKVRLKDTWVLIERGEIHLFFLAEKPDDALNNRVFGHAVSRDWLEWETLEPIDPKGSGDDWDAGTPGTGHVFKYDDGRYYLAYTGRRWVGKNLLEDIGLMVSDDLRVWEKTAGNPIWPCATAPPYERQDKVPRAAWRDPFVVQNPAGEWEAFCAARLDRGAVASRGCVARARLKSATLWQTVEPLRQEGNYTVMEVPEIFALDGRYWLLFSTGGTWLGQALNAAGRERVCGTFYLLADEWNGPYREPAGGNLLIGSGGGRFQGYVGRAVRYDGEMLLYHHYHNDLRSFALPKVLASAGERLYLQPWQGINRLRLHPLPVRGWRELPVGHAGLALPGEWEFGRGRISGTVGVGGSVAMADAGSSDLDISLAMALTTATAAGVIVGMHERGGIALVLDAELGQVRMTHFAGMGAYGPMLDVPLDRIALPLAHGRKYALRILKRGRFCEAYVDGEMRFSVATGFAGKAGLGLLVQNGGAQFEITETYALKSLTVSDWPGSCASRPCRRSFAGEATV